MLCENCKKNMATTHFHQVINGEEKEFYLCDECADSLGVKPFINPVMIDFGDFLGQVFGQTAKVLNPSESQIRKCEMCGATFEDIVKTGKAGCSNCYTEFYSQLLPSIQRIHGKTEHTGKISKNAGESAKIKSELKKLTNELNKAIEEQRFEYAAELRDKIKLLEKGEI